MKIYLAARYSRRLELCGYRDALVSAGHQVTSRWLNGDHQVSDSGKPIGSGGEALVEGDDGATSKEAQALRSKFAMEDIEDVVAADCCISFTEPPRSGASRGGRHVEFGVALAEGKRLIVVGHRENIFHWLPQVEFYHSWSVMHLHLFASSLPISAKPRDIVQETIEERGKVYGDPFLSHQNIGLSWTGLILQHFGITLDHPLPAALVAQMMVTFKMQRAARVYHADNLVDAEAYLRFVGDFQQRSNSAKP